MERHLGASLADVRVHADASAGRSALDLSAQAFVRGRDIYFAPGFYQPQTAAGQGLLAHELTHVVQQRNGRFQGANQGPRAAAGRRELEGEAEQAARSISGSGGGLSAGSHGSAAATAQGPWHEGFLAARSSGMRIEHAAAEGGVQCSASETLAAIRAAASGGVEAVADWIAAHVEEAKSGIVGRLNALRAKLRGMTYVRIPRDTVAEMERLAAEMRSEAPSWLPLPTIQFQARPVQQVAVVDDIAVLAVLLFLAFIMVMWWLIGQADPRIRHSREEAMRRIVEAIEDGLRPAPPVTVDPPPITQPTTDTTPTIDTAPPDTYERSRDKEKTRAKPEAIPRTVEKEDDKDPNAMRFQVQWDTGFGGPTFALPTVAPKETGVTTVQAVATLGAVMATVVPKAAREAAAPAAAKQVRWILSRPPAGIAQGGFSKSEYFVYGRARAPRVDVENIRGHNLRT